MKSAFFRAWVSRKFIGFVVVFFCGFFLSGVGSGLALRLPWSVSGAFPGKVPEDMGAFLRWQYFLGGVPLGLGALFGWGIAAIIGGAAFRLRPLHCLALAAGCNVVVLAAVVLSDSTLDPQLFKSGALEQFRSAVRFFGPVLAAAAVSALLGCWIGNRLRARLSRVRQSPQVA